MDRKIPGDVINEWKTLTNQYFSYSPNAYLIQNQNYHVISEPMRIKLVKKNLMLDFQDKHDIFFTDPEFGFKGDNKLITRIIACLQYEYLKPGEPIISMNVVSSGIFFI